MFARVTLPTSLFLSLLNQICLSVDCVSSVMLKGVKITSISEFNTIQTVGKQPGQWNVAFSQSRCCEQNPNLKVSKGRWLVRTPKSPGSQQVKNECACLWVHWIIQLGKFDLLVINACQKTRNSFLSKNIAFVVTHFFSLELSDMKFHFPSCCTVQSPRVFQHPEVDICNRISGSCCP